MHISYGQFFFKEMRAFDAPSRKFVLAAMREIEVDPWSRKPGRAELPPMWRPGTFSQAAGRFMITYCRDGDGESLRFLHVRVDGHGWSPNMM